MMHTFTLIHLLFTASNQVLRQRRRKALDCMSFAREKRVALAYRTVSMYNFT